MVAGLLIIFEELSCMEPTRKNRYHSSENFPQEEDPPNYLSAFLRSSRSPSFLQVRAPAQTKPGMQRVVGEGRGELEELRGHYECIEKVLNDQNANLKMQAKYLVAEMRKSLRREKTQKEELTNLNNLYVSTKAKLEEIEQDNSLMREYVESKIIFMLNALKLTNLHDLQQEIRRIIQEFCEYFSINLELKNLPRTEKPPTPPLPQIQPQITNKIDQLNDKFEALMSEYKSTSRPEIRKQCIDIAKQIKQLKADRDGLNDASRMEKTVENLSRNHSQQYLSVKNKNVFHFDDDRRESLQKTDEKGFGKNPSQTLSRYPSRMSSHNPYDRPSSFRHPLQKF